MNKTLNIIAAVDEQFGFGKDGKIPWHYPEDFKFFSKITKGNTVIMGRKTYDDLLTYSKKDDGSILPGRDCIVVTSSLLPHELTPDGSPRGITLECKSDEIPLYRASTISEALSKAKDLRGEVFFIGGESIFDSGLNMADRVYLTLIPGIKGCDRFFPMEKLNEKYNLHEVREGGDGLKFATYVNSTWGTLRN